MNLNLFLKSDNSGDLRPTRYREDPTRPDSLGFSMPSHAELEENYKTVVTSESKTPEPTLAEVPEDFVFESKKLR